jgi:hypothetical protein
LKYDPRPALQAIQSKILRFFIDRDIFELDVGSASKLWDDPAVLKILKKQHPDGSWPDKNAKKHMGCPYQLPNGRDLSKFKNFNFKANHR